MKNRDIAEPAVDWRMDYEFLDVVSQPANDCIRRFAFAFQPPDLGLECNGFCASRSLSRVRPSFFKTCYCTLQRFHLGS